MGYIWDIYGIYVGIYVVIRHNFTCTSSNIIYCIFSLNVANFTLVKPADVYLTDLLNTFVP